MLHIYNFLFEEDGRSWVIVKFRKRLCVKRLKPIFHCDAKTFALGPRVGFRAPKQNFALEIQTCWYLKMLKFALPPTRNQNTGQWNIGCVGSQTQISRVGHVYFISLGVDFICVGSRFSVKYGLKNEIIIKKKDNIHW